MHPLPNSVYTVKLSFAKFNKAKFYMFPKLYTQYYLAGDVRCTSYT